MCRIMKLEILEGHIASMMSCQGVQEWETMLFTCGMNMIGKQGRVEMSLWKLDSGEIITQLSSAVAGTVLVVYWELSQGGRRRK